MKYSKSDLVLKTGVRFKGEGIIDPGKVVQRYNISKAKLEFYFIPSEKMNAFYMARFNQDLNAHKKFGTPMKNSGS